MFSAQPNAGHRFGKRSRRLAAFVVSTSLLVGGVALSETPLPQAAALSQSQVGGIRVVEGLVNQPFQDQMGYQPVAMLADSDRRARAMRILPDLFPEGLTGSAAVAQENLSRLVSQLDYQERNRALLQGTELNVPFTVDSGPDQRRLMQSYPSDVRSFTGLYFNPAAEPVPGTESDSRLKLYLDVWVDSPNTDRGLQLAVRQIGRADSRSYRDLGYRNTSLHRGYNRVALDLGMERGAAELPYAIYIRNFTGADATVRILSADAYKSASQSGAPAGQPASAAPAVLGAQLGTYPVYQHDTANPAAFYEFLELARASAANDSLNRGVDFRFGRQDLSASLRPVLELFNDVQDPASAAAAAELAYDTVMGRLEYFDRINGTDPNDADDRNRPQRAQQVLVMDENVTQPSPMYAFTNYYHMPGSRPEQYSFLRGNLQNMYTWAHSHEFGHVIDNTAYKVAEITNNLYSLAGAYVRAEDQWRSGRTPTVNGVAHGGISNGRRLTDFWLESKMNNPELTPETFSGKGTFLKADLFNRTHALYNLLRYWDNYDYSGYDYSASPYTPELAAEVGQYGTLGVVNRTYRTQPGFSMPNEFPSDARPWDRLLKAATYSSGFNLCPTFERLGFTGITPELSNYCAQYPEPPVKLEYFSFDMDLLQARQATLGDVAPFDATVRTEVQAAATEKGVELRLSTTSQPESVAVYEIYRDGKLIGLSRDGSFLDLNATEPEAYSAIAYDYRLNASQASNFVPEVVAESELPEVPAESPSAETPVDPAELPTELPEEGGTGLPEETTEDPSTVEPVTEAPVTDAPVTEAPVTAAPTPAAPATKPAPVPAPSTSSVASPRPVATASATVAVPATSTPAAPASTTSVQAAPAPSSSSATPTKPVPSEPVPSEPVPAVTAAPTVPPVPSATSVVPVPAATAVPTATPNSTATTATSAVATTSTSSSAPVVPSSSPAAGSASGSSLSSTPVRKSVAQRIRDWFQRVGSWFKRVFSFGY